MSKSKEELEALKKEVEDFNEKCRELTEEELAQVTGGVSPAGVMPVIFAQELFDPNTASGNGGAINGIDPSDIKSLDILKDESATAIYGSRGAN